MTTLNGKMTSSVWKTPSGNNISYDELIVQVREHSNNGGQTYLGTDSFVERDRCVFATAICFHGARNQRGGQYLYQRTYHDKNVFPVLVTRILAEVQNTIELALRVSGEVPQAQIELHLDISSADAGNGTSRFCKMLTGDAESSGFTYKIKPEAWASQSVADKHSK